MQQRVLCTENKDIMHILREHIFAGIVRGARDSRANLMPIYGDLYQIKL